MKSGYYWGHFLNSPEWMVVKVDGMGDAWICGSFDPYGVEDFVFGPEILPPS